MLAIQSKAGNVQFLAGLPYKRPVTAPGDPFANTIHLRRAMDFGSGRNNQAAVMPDIVRHQTNNRRLDRRRIHRHNQLALHQPPKRRVVLTQRIHGRIFFRRTRVKTDWGDFGGFWELWRFRFRGNRGSLWRFLWNAEATDVTVHSLYDLRFRGRFIRSFELSLRRLTVSKTGALPEDEPNNHHHSEQQEGAGFCPKRVEKCARCHFA